LLPLAIETPEDTPVRGRVSTVNSQAGALTFVLSELPAKGIVLLDSVSGAFTYTPHGDATGTDSFSVVASVADGGQSLPVQVSVAIAPVNDVPEIQAIADQVNSAEQLISRIKLATIDADGDLLNISVSTSDPRVATASFDPNHGELVLSPVDYGRTTIEVTAKDGRETARRSFTFQVTDVTRRTVLATQTPERDGVVIENRSGRASRFVLEHNDAPVFKDLDHVVSHVRSLPDEVAGEGFERKLWRYLRDGTVHFIPLMPLQFRQAPWATLNSLGFGFCGDMATSYVAIARAAGYQARVWSLGGHVVPEILVNGRWQLYDPDLGVYYHNRHGKVASIDDLTSDPALIEQPQNPVIANLGGRPYTRTAASIYGSTQDNFVADSTLLPSVPDMAGIFELPAGATLTYPGRWTDTPVAYVAFGEHILFESELPNWRARAAAYDGSATFDTPFHRQARLDLPHGYTGDLPLPLWLWDIQGQGTVQIDGIAYQVGTAELTERLRYRMPARQITVLESKGMGLVMQINFLRFSMRTNNTVALTGRDVGALRVTARDLGRYQAGEAWTWVNRRPLGSD